MSFVFWRIRKVTRKWLRWSYHRCVKYVKHVARRIRKHKFHFRIRVKFTNKKLRKCVRKSVRRMILIVRRRTFKIKKCVFRYIFKFHISRSKKIYKLYNLTVLFHILFFLLLFSFYFFIING